MNPGRELDALIAEKVMGLGTFYDDDVLFVTYPPMGANSPCPPYSTDIASAWDVVEKMKWDWLRLERFENRWSAGNVEICGDEEYIKFLGVGQTAPHAICLAALKAVEHQA